MEIKTTEFFKNIKNLPPPGTKEFEDLVRWEEEKIKGGLTVNGIKIPGWLYWHLNHWWIRVDYIDEWGNEARKESLPELRDNEWIRAEALENCRIEKKGYMEIGGRQGGKSEMEASYFGMNALMYKLTQNVIVCGNDNDLGLLKDKVDFGLRKVWKGINIPRLDKTWTKNQIRLGYKTSDGEDQVWSYIVIRNAKDGHNTEASAGTTAKSFIMDEVGKYPFSQTYEAGVPAMRGKSGEFRAVPILVGTGGAFENGKDAENFFYNPDANNFLSFRDQETNKETCLFLSGLYRQDCKQEQNLADYLISQGIEIKERDELEKIIIQASDKEKARLKIEKEREAKKKNPDKTVYLKQVMYYPLTVDECFLSIGDNSFPIELARQQQLRLSTGPKVATPVYLIEDEGTIRHVFTDKQPISNFPVKPHEPKDAPIMIYEFPVSNPPYGLYVAGVDPYRQSNSEYSDSLGTVYIFKRMHDITSEKYQNMIVASYTARPDKKEDWNEQARLLIKYYEALALVENDEYSFIDYMISKGDASTYLQKQPSWIRDVVPNTTVTREYGVHRSSDKIREFLHDCYKRYLKETLFIEKDAEGNVIKEVWGVNRIFDPMLLEETIKYNDKEGNYDRVVAIELALAQSYKMDPVYGPATDRKDTRYEQIGKARKYRGKLFPTQTRSIPRRTQKLF